MLHYGILLADTKPNGHVTNDVKWPKYRGSAANVSMPLGVSTPDKQIKKQLSGLI